MDESKFEPIHPNNPYLFPTQDQGCPIKKPLFECTQANSCSLSDEVVQEVVWETNLKVVKCEGWIANETKTGGGSPEEGNDENRGVQSAVAPLLIATVLAICATFGTPF